MHIICGANCNTRHEERAQRILWPKDIIQGINNDCCKTSCSHNSCNGIQMWMENNRLYIYHKSRYYLTIVENRKDYWILITAYYVSDIYQRKKLNKKYHDSKFKI